MINASDFVTAFRPWTLFTPKDVWDFSRRFFPKDVVPDPYHFKDWILAQNPYKLKSWVDQLTTPNIHGPLLVYANGQKVFIGQNQINLIVTSLAFDLYYSLPYVLEHAEKTNSTEYGDTTIRLHFRALKSGLDNPLGSIDVSQPMHALIEFVMGRSLERAHDNGDWERALDAWDRLQHPAEESTPESVSNSINYDAVMKAINFIGESEEPEEDEEDEEEEEPEGGCHTEDCPYCKADGLEWNAHLGKWVLP